MLRIPFTLLCCLAAFPATAISNIEGRRPSPPKEGLSGQVELSANGKSGNVEEDRYGAAVNLILKDEKDTFFTLFSKARGETQGIKTADEAFAHARWMHQQTPHAATEGFVQWQENEFNRLLSRYLIGGGGRFQVLMVPDHYSFTLGLGVLHEWERDDLTSFIDENEAWRLNSYWVYKHQLDSGLNWHHTFYLQPNLEEFDDYRVLSELGLTVRLTGSLHLKLLYQLSRDSRPPRNPGVNPPFELHKTNTEYSTSLVYVF